MGGRIPQRKIDEAFRAATGEVDEALRAVRERGRAVVADVDPGAGWRGARRGDAQFPGSSRCSPASVPLPGMLARVERAPFVGRAAALRRLRTRWEEAARNQGGLVVVAGDLGIGKTRLTARFAATAHDKGDVVLYGRADEDRVSPYQPFVEALRQYAACRPGCAAELGFPAALVGELASLVPELAPSAARSVLRARGDGECSRHQLFDAVVRLLLHAAASRRLLLVLEDLQWADVATVLLLRQLLRRSAASRLLVVATYDDLEADPSGPLARLLTDLRREATLDMLRLGGLQPSETAALVTACLGRDRRNSALARRLCDATGGNPFFIEELLKNSTEPSATVAVPQGVKDVIGRRLDRLPPETLEMLTLAAVLGSDFRLAALTAVAVDRKEDSVIASLENAVSAGLIVEDVDEVDRFSFTHALVRETLYDRPIASRRLRLHRRVAVALEAAPLAVHPAELAHHYFEALKVGGAAKAVVFCLQAAQARQTAHAYEDAARHYERALTALEIAGRDDAAARCDVLLALGAARWQASEPDPRSTYAQVVKLARGLGSADRLARAALGAGGRFYAPWAIDRAYIKLLEEAIAALEPGDSALRVRLLSRLAENLVFAPPPERVDRLAREAVAMARRLGEPAALAAALMARHAALLHSEHAHERLRLSEQVLALAGELDARELDALGHHWLLYDLVELGRLHEARHRHAQLELLAADLQQPLYRHSSLAWSGVLAGLAGRFDEAERLAHGSLRLAQQAEAPDAQRHFTAQLLALRREQGRLDELLPAIERLAGDDPSADAWCSVLPLAYLDAGDRTQAHAAYARALGDGAATIPRTMVWLTAIGSLAEAAAQLGDADGCADLHALLEPHADRFVQWSFTGNAGSVHRLLGRTAAVAGWRDLARDHFEAALERHAALGAAPQLARTRCDYGEFLLQGRRADRPRALRMLRDAAAAARRLGMAGIGARARAHADGGISRCSY